MVGYRRTIEIRLLLFICMLCWRWGFTGEIEVELILDEGKVVRKACLLVVIK